jgi:hypothetical protein
MVLCSIDKDSPYESTGYTFFNHKGLADTLGSIGMRISVTECLARDYTGKAMNVIKQSNSFSIITNWRSTPNKNYKPMRLQIIFSMNRPRVCPYEVLGKLPRWS